MSTNWKRIAARRWPGYSIIGSGKHAVLDRHMGVVRLFATRLEMLTSAAPGLHLELAEESPAARPRDLRCFEADPA